MWPACIDDLQPFPRPFREGPPVDMADAFRAAGWAGELPVRMVALLGVCSTRAYKDCPHMPSWHVERAEWDGDGCYDAIGKYYWCDFDVIDRGGSVTSLRMAFNEGDADCNDGTWGLAWDRATAEVVADITTDGGNETLIRVRSEPLLRRYQPHDRPPLTDLSAADDWYWSMLPYRLTYGHDAEVERVIGLAMNWCMPYRSDGPEYELHINARDWPAHIPPAANPDLAHDRVWRLRNDLEAVLGGVGESSNVLGSPPPGGPDVLWFKSSVRDGERAAAAVVRRLQELGASPDTVVQLSGPFTPPRTYTVARPA